MSDELDERWILNGKSDAAKCFGVSVNTVSNWLLRGCPTLKAEGKHKFRFYVPAVVGWLSLGDTGDGNEPPELSVARAQLAVSQTEKTKVEIAIKQAQLGHILSGGVIPVKAARELLDWGELLVFQTIEQMAIRVPDAFDGDYRKDLEIARGATFRLRCIISEHKFPARDDFRKAARNLLARYAGRGTDADPHQPNGEHNDDV